MFLQQDYVIIYHQHSFKELLDFNTLSYALIYMHVLFIQYYKAHIRY